jgi:hypothetical protein
VLKSGARQRPGGEGAVHAGGGQGVEVSVRWAGGGRTGRERRRWARRSWRRGSESSERERGRTRGIFLDETITSVGHL